MCDTSNSPAAWRVARCSSTTDVYQTGMSQPANGTIFAPRDLCVSCSDVNLTGGSTGSTHSKEGSGSFWTSELKQKPKQEERLKLEQQQEQEQKLRREERLRLEREQEQKQILRRQEQLKLEQEQMEKQKLRREKQLKLEQEQMEKQKRRREQEEQQKKK